MAGSDLMRTPLAAVVWPATGARALTRGVVLALFGSLLLWASAKVQVPFWPVPCRHASPRFWPA
jgi:biotin transport system substrate-specific component